MLFAQSYLSQYKGYYDNYCLLYKQLGHHNSIAKLLKYEQHLTTVYDLHVSKNN